MINVFKDMGYIQDENELEKSLFMSIYRCSWADNGDAISITYAGTPALKGDVTRTGKRSVKGMLDDGVIYKLYFRIINFSLMQLLVIMSTTFKMVSSIIKLILYIN